MASIYIDVHPFMDRGQRENQEDFFYADPPPREGVPWLAGVADGMGGHTSGDVASKTGIHAMKQSFDAAMAARRETGQALVGAVGDGHQAVLAAAERVNAVGNMGSTIVAFAIDGQTLHWCSAGDSRLYLCRAGKLQQLSRDFTLAVDMREGVRKGEWNEEDIGTSPQRNALTSFMGTDNWRHHDGRVQLQNGDIVVACSDGVHGTIDAAGIESACVAGSGSAGAEQIAANMLRRVLDVRKANQDNSTAVIVRVSIGQAAVSVAQAPPAGPARGAGLALIGSGLAVLLVIAVLAYKLWPAVRPAAVATPSPQAPALQRTPPSGPDAGSVPRDAAAATPNNSARDVAAPIKAKPDTAADEWKKEVARIEEDIDNGRLAVEYIPAVIRELRSRLPKEAEPPELRARLQALPTRKPHASVRKAEAAAAVRGEGQSTASPSPNGAAERKPTAKAASDKALADKATKSKAAGGRTIADRKGQVDAAAMDKASPGKPQPNKAAVEAKAGNDSLAETPSAEKPLVDKAAAEKTAAEKATAEKAAAEKAVADKAAADKTTSGKAAEKAASSGGK